jgi:PAS domain S-box-containing protein
MSAFAKIHLAFCMLIALALFGVSSLLYAQDHVTVQDDQLTNYRLKSNSELYQIITDLRQRSIDSALMIAQIVHGNVVLKSDLADQIESLILLTELNIYAGHLEEAYQLEAEFTLLADNSSDVKIKAMSSAGIARIAFIEREYKSCLQHYFDALSYAEQVNEPVFMGDLQFRISKIYFVLNDHENTQYYLDKSLKSDFAKDDYNIFRLQQFLGNLFFAQGKYDSAFAALNRSWQYALILPHNENALGSVKESLAKFYIRLNQLDMAIAACDEGMEYYKISGSDERISTLYTYLAHIYSLRDDYNMAMIYNKKALAIREKLGINYLVISSLNNIGGDFIELGLTDSAMVYFEKALAIEKFNKSDFYVSAIYKNMYELNLINNNYGHALEYYRLYRDFEDSVTSSKSNKSIAEMRIKYDLEKEKNSRKSIELSQSQDIQIILISFSILLVVFLFMLIYRFREKRKDNLLLQQRNITINEKNRQLDSALSELKINEQKYRALADHIPGIVFRLYIDPVEKMIFYNSRFAELTGFTEDDFEHEHQSNLSKMILTEDVQGVIDARQKAIRENRPYNIVYRFIHGGSNIKYYNEIGKSISDPRESQSVIDGLIFDVTDKKLTEHELMVALEKARESDRLKSTFLSTISHELRTPLNAIIGFSNLIDHKTPLPLVQEYLEIVKGSGDHLLELVEDLFDISLIESNNISIHPSTGVIEETIKLVENIIKTERKKMGKEGIELHLHIPDDKTLSIYTDLRKLKQILINLLKNALKFTAVGKIDYGFTMDKRGDRSYYKFFVKDTGIGIPSGKVNFIFDVFRQVDDSDTRLYEGVGIGLSVAKRYVELLGGRIWVETALGKGSSFYFTLPAESNKEELSIQDVFPNKFEKSYVGKTILIAEDVPSAYTLLKILLEKEGFVTIWAKNGRQAVNYCQTVPEIQLVLMDLKMPDMSGFDATRIIKKDFPNLPIIAQTAYAVEGDREKAMEAGFDEYIEKPIQKAKMFQIIYKILANKSTESL